MLLLVAVAVLGMGFYLVRFVVFGHEWASAPFNQTVYRRGLLVTGTLTDRNGVVLASVTDGVRTFAESRDVRRATLHTVGDLQGNIGTGALTVYASDMIGYSFFTGSYSRTGEGSTTALTIDSKLNVEAFKALNGRRGVVMVSNYKTGEVLCMVSNPSFDPDDPPADVSGPSFEGVYLNRAISSAYTPGSVYKLLTAAAAIEKTGDVYDRVFECTGELKTGLGSLTCPRVHGNIGFERGVELSCNIVFGELALELGADTLAEYAGKYGLSGRLEVGGIITARGNFDKAGPDTANLAWSGVGQYNNTVCPAAMLRFVGAVANNGNAAEMFLLKKSGVQFLLPASTTRIMNRNTAVLLGELMELQSSSFPGLQLHAKSGTAQVGRDTEPHAWYTGYITNDNFPLAFVVVVENGGSGTAVAGPVANRVLQAAVNG